MKKKLLMLLLMSTTLTTALYAYSSLSSKTFQSAYILENQGYTIRGSKDGCLDQGEYTYRSIYLYSGIDYVFLGVADSIRDMDTTIYDENWNRISIDEDKSATSVVTVTPSWDGTFYIKVKAYRGSGCYSQVIGWK